MPHETYWLPYPSLMAQLGYERQDRQGKSWVKRDKQNPRFPHFIYWGTTRADPAELACKEGPYIVFRGELQSEQEFLTLLRQIRWEPTLFAT